MREEMDSLKENDTYELTQLPEGRSAVGGRWIYTVKSSPNSDEKFKARYVAKGYAQVRDLDYHETFSPTARITSIRMLLQLALQENLIVHQMDVSSAYLNAPIDCEIFVDQPEGFEQYDRNGKKLFFRLKKSIYGLKQSGRNWYELLHNFLLKENFDMSLADSCVYSKKVGNLKIIIIFWVDDIIIACSNEQLLNDTKRSLCQNFRMKDFGKLSWFLGIEFKQDSEKFVMVQTRYIEKLLNRFNMKDCKPKATPCDLCVSKVMVSDSEKLPDPRLYREVVGSLIYVMTCTRPDLCYIVTKLSQNMCDPTKAHLNMAKHVLRYLKGTLNIGLTFRKQKSEILGLQGFCDSDWGASSDRRSITGYGFSLCKKGPLISWKSRKQQIVALSTCEAEYVALTSAIQEAKFLSQLLVDMNGGAKSKVILNVDNQGAICLAKNPVHHQRTKLM